MTELVGFGFAAALLAVNVLTERRHALERRRLLDALMSRNAGEFARLAVKPVEAAKTPKAEAVVQYPAIGL